LWITEHILCRPVDDEEADVQSFAKFATELASVELMPASSSRGDEVSASSKKDRSTERGVSGGRFCHNSAVAKPPARDTALGRPVLFGWSADLVAAGGWGSVANLANDCTSASSSSTGRHRMCSVIHNAFSSW
jgi:hypothetical protein